MSILIDENTKMMVYGMTGNYGTNQVKAMTAYGAKVVAGVSAGKGGTTHLDIPITDTGKEAVELYGANTAVVYMPAAVAANTTMEAICSGVKTIFLATEGIPLQETIVLRKEAKERGVHLIGPNSMGLISPGKTLVGSIPPEFCRPGFVGAISRSGSLSATLAKIITDGGYGESTVISVGGDSVIGMNPVEYMQMFEEDPETKAVVMLGEAGGTKEYEVVEYLPKMKTPVVAFICGRSAPPGKRMGHMGAIVSSADQTADSKAKALAAAGATVVDIPWDIPRALREIGFEPQYK